MEYSIGNTGKKPIKSKNAKKSEIQKIMLRRYAPTKEDQKDTEAGLNSKYKTGHSKITKENSTNREWAKTYQKLDAREAKRF